MNRCLIVYAFNDILCAVIAIAIISVVVIRSAAGERSGTRTAVRWRHTHSHTQRHKVEVTRVYRHIVRRTNPNPRRDGNGEIFRHFLHRGRESRAGAGVIGTHETDGRVFAAAIVHGRDRCRRDLFPYNFNELKCFVYVELNYGLGEAARSEGQRAAETRRRRPNR